LLQSKYMNNTKIRHGVFLRTLHPTDPSIICSAVNTYVLSQPRIIKDKSSRSEPIHTYAL